MTAAHQPLAGADIEAIERATLDAVAPQWVDALDDEAWLLPMDPGTVGRARSAVPLRHQAPHADPTRLLERIEERYAARGFPTQLRVAEATVAGRSTRSDMAGASPGSTCAWP